MNWSVHEESSILTFLSDHYNDIKLLQSLVYLLAIEFKWRICYILMCNSISIGLPKIKYMYQKFDYTHYFLWYINNSILKKVFFYVRKYNVPRSIQKIFWVPHTREIRALILLATGINIFSKFKEKIIRMSFFFLVAADFRKHFLWNVYYFDAKKSQIIISCSTTMFCK